jgi:1,4-dihydroxy-2-naphthoyl-CoA hydrolase
LKQLFNPAITLEELNRFSQNTLAEHLGIIITAIGADFLEAKMPVDHRTHQPHGLLHGGASVALAESLGSIAAYCTLDSALKTCVGLEINANHIKGVRSGYVIAVARPLHVGQRTQVWEIKIHNEQKELVCVSRITMSVIDKR